MKAEIVTARYEHISHIAANVRESDRQELFDYSLLSPVEALERSYSISKLAWTGLIDGEPVVMFGVVSASLLSDTGIPWMIGTTELDKHQITFLKRCKPVVHKMNMCYKRLENYVAAYNIKAIQWLKWLRFEFDEPQPMGLFKKPFIKFHMGN